MKAYRVKLLSAALILGALIVTQALMAQGGSGPPPPPGGTSGPIDSGVFVLLIAAAAYGYKEIKAREEKSENTL